MNDNLTSPILGSIPESKKRGVNPIIMIGALFFVFGFVTWLNSVLIPYLRIACELNNFQAYLVAFSFYIAYLVMALPSARILRRTGFKNGMSLGLVIMAIGALFFIPAAMTRTYTLFLFGLFVQGTGLAVLQTAANPYVTIIGPLDSAAKRISIMGICNKLAGAIAPIILGTIALKNADTLVKGLKIMSTSEKIVTLNELSARVIFPYTVIICAFLILAGVIYFSTLPEIDTDREDDMTVFSNRNKTSIFEFPHLMLGAVAMFLYVGVEVIAGDTIISFGASQGIALSTAKFFTTCTLIGMIIGYSIGIITIPKYISQAIALRICAVLGVLFALGALLVHGYMAVFFIALLGLANSLMFPAIFPLAISGLGKFTKVGSSILVMALSGGAIIPLIYGRLADVITPHYAYIITIPCYLFILYYAISGYNPKKAH